MTRMASIAFHAPAKTVAPVPNTEFRCILPVDNFKDWAEIALNTTNTGLGYMISNERPSPYGRRPYQQSQGYGASKYNQQPRPPVNEDTLKSAEIQIERKNFVFTLKENPRGRFLRITEERLELVDLTPPPPGEVREIPRFEKRAIGR